jgi:hypothetical protein
MTMAVMPVVTMMAVVMVMAPPVVMMVAEEKWDIAVMVMMVIPDLLGLATARYA